MEPAPRLHIGFAPESRCVPPFCPSGRGPPDHQVSLYSSFSWPPYGWISGDHGLGVSEQSIPLSPVASPVTSQNPKLSNTPPGLSMNGMALLYPTSVVEQPSPLESNFYGRQPAVHPIPATEKAFHSIHKPDLPFTTSECPLNQEEHREIVRPPSRKLAWSCRIPEHQLRTAREVEEIGKDDEKQKDEAYQDFPASDPPPPTTTTQKSSIQSSLMESRGGTHDPSPDDGADVDAVDYQAIKYRQYLSELIAAGYD